MNRFEFLHPGSVRPLTVPSWVAGFILGNKNRGLPPTLPAVQAPHVQNRLADPDPHTFPSPIRPGPIATKNDPHTCQRGAGLASEIVLDGERGKARLDAASSISSRRE